MDVKEDTNVVKSVDELSGLSTALSHFTSRFNELQQHMEYIDKSINNFYKKQFGIESKDLGVVPSQNTSSSTSVVASILSSANQTIGNSTSIDKKTSHTSLECFSGGRALRRYITLNISDVEMLREELTKGLKHAPNPAKLVLDCIGRFYLQGSKAYTKDSPMVANRQASLLILEFFLLSDCQSIEESVKEEATQAVIAWKKRLIGEGGISKASTEDARGLLFLVAAYGVPADFRNLDLIDLISLCRVREVSDALRRSTFLKRRIPDIVKDLVKEGKCQVAIDTVYALGEEENFPPETILISYLREFKEDWKKAKRDSQGSPTALKHTDQRQLSRLKTVKKCIEDNKINPSKLSEWNINGQISNLEKEIADLEKNGLKRKAEELDYLNRRIMLPNQSFYDGGVSGQVNGYPGIPDFALTDTSRVPQSAWRVGGAAMNQYLMGPSPQGVIGSGLEQGFSGQASGSVGFGVRSSGGGADLYNFADSVLDSLHLRQS